MSDILNTLYSVGRLVELPELAKRLEIELGWKPVYWITQPELEEAVKREFPEALCHDFTAGNRACGDPVARADLPPVVAAKTEITQLEWQQLVQTLSRHVLGNAIGVEQQITIINERLDYCMRVVSALKIERFILASTPHCLLDMCFFVAVRALGGEARMHHLTGFRGLQIILDQHSALPRALSSVNTVENNRLSSEGEEVLGELMDKEQNQTPWYIINQNKNTAKQARLYKAADEILDAGTIIPGVVSFDTPPLLGKTSIEYKKKNERKSFFSRKKNEGISCTEPRKDVFARSFQEKHDKSMRRAFIHRPDGFEADPITWKEYYTYRDWALIQKQAWRRKYNILTKEFDFKTDTVAPFVFFALHYQPERTTMPDGGRFVDQELALRMISDCLPKGWTLLVKEHPSQFLWQTEGELGRDNAFYDRLASLSGVRLVPLEVESQALVERAAAVVTVTGTVGWEAALHGVPAITLAHPWYAGEGVTLPATDESTLNKAFERVKQGWKPKMSSIKEHLAKIEAIGMRCFVNPSHGPLYEELSVEKNLEALVSLFVNTERLIEISK